MKRILPLIVVLIAGIGIGYVLGSGASESPGAPPAPQPRPSPAPDLPDEPSPELLQLESEVASLREKNAELETKLEQLASEPGDAGLEDDSPVRVAGKTEDPEKGELKVTVTDAQGRPMPNAILEIYYYPKGGSGSQRSVHVTGPDGTLALPDLPPGKRSISAKLPGGYRSITAQIKGGRITEAVIPAPSGGATVEALVVHQEKGPLSEVHLTLSRKEELFNDNFYGRTDERGRYRFEGIPEGSYTLKGAGGGLGYPGPPAAQVEVPEGGLVQAEIRAGVPTLTGVVRDAQTGNPIAGVSLQIQQGGPYRNVSTDADGVYRFLDLPPGDFRFCVSKDGYGIVFPAHKTTKTVEMWDLELAPAATLKLLIKDPKGRPCSGKIGISIHSKDPDSKFNLGTSITADDTGLAVFERAVPGHYEITLRMEGIGSAKVEVKLAAGENILDVRLE